MAAAAVIALQTGTACSEAAKDTADINDGKYVLTVNLDSGLSMTTRAALNKAGEKEIKNVQIFVFNGDGSLDSYHSGSESSQIKIRCTSGKKRIFSFVNAESLSTYTDSTALLSQATLLSENLEGGFVMTGRASAVLPSESAVTVKVSRIAARIGIGNIAVNFTSDGYKSLPFTVKSIYMINVAGNTDYSFEAGPTLWLNQSEHKDIDMDALLYTSINHSLSEETPLTADQYFYVYPNPTASDDSGTPFSARYTRLVVETELNGATLFYSISLPGIERNKTYMISNLTITRPGTERPDEEITSEECAFNIEVEDWIPGSVQDIVI